LFHRGIYQESRALAYPEWNYWIRDLINQTLTNIPTDKWRRDLSRLKNNDNDPGI